MQVNNKIVANWLKIATDLQSQLVVSEEDKIKLSTQIATLTAEVERLREGLTQIASGAAFDSAYPNTDFAVYAHLEDGYFVASEVARTVLQPKAGEG